MAHASKPQILCVEDDPALSEMMRTLLEMEGYQVLEAANGAEAVKLARLAHPDLILMDLQLPGMSGLEATRRIRGIPEMADIPIIAVTGFVTEFDEVRTRAAGCNAHITKPFDLPQLRKAIQDLLP